MLTTRNFFSLSFNVLDFIITWCVMIMFNKNVSLNTFSVDVLRKIYVNNTLNSIITFIPNFSSQYKC